MWRTTVLAAAGFNRSGSGRPLFTLASGTSPEMGSRMARGRELVGAFAAICTLALAACGSSSSNDPTKSNFAGGIATPQVTAPPLKLQDSLGKQVNIDNYRGKAVLVTFIYAHCPDVCPLIVGHLHTALEKLGADRNKFQIIAVSVDPKGDTPKTVKKFLAAHQMTGKMEYLIGSRPTLEKVWKAWHIAAASRPTKKIPDAV